MRLVFFGTPKIAADILSEVLQAGHEVVAVVSQPPKEAGRGKKKTPSHVAKLAQEKGCLLFEPFSAKDPHFLSELKKLQPDVIVVVAFGQILIQELLDIPPLGCINVHASLLPKYRGAAPMERVLMNGECKTGVTLMKMVRQMDAGDIILAKEIPLTPRTTLGELQKEMMLMGAQVLLEGLKLYEQKEPKGRAQDESEVTFAPKIAKEDRIISWEKEAAEIHNQVRGLSPRPSAICFLEIHGEKKQLKILEASLLDEGQAQALDQKLKPAEILFDKGHFYIGTLKGTLELKSVQLEGKAAMSATEFTRGLQEGSIAPFAY